MKTLSSIINEALNQLSPLTRVLCAPSNFRRYDLEGLDSKDYPELIKYIQANCKSVKKLAEHTDAQVLFDTKKGAIQIRQSKRDNKISDIYIYVKGCEIHLCMSYAYCQVKHSANFCKFYEGVDDVWVASEKDLLKLISSIEVPYGKALFAQHDELIAELKQHLGITAKTIEVK